MLLIDSYLNSDAFDDVDATYCDPTTTAATQDGPPLSPWTASFPEITEKIFVEMRDALRLDHSNCQSAWLRLTRVCRAWRQLALDTPALWTHLRMYNISHIGELERLLSLSGDLLVNLELNFGRSQSLLLSAADFEGAIKFAVWLHGHRIAAFDVSCFTENLMPIYRIDSILYFPDRVGVEVSLEPQTIESPSKFPWSVVRLQGGSFPRLSGPLQDGETRADARKVLRIVGKAGRHIDPVERNYWQAFGLRIPRVVYAFWSLTHLYLEYCGPQDRERSVLEKIILPQTFRSLAITDGPREMRMLLSHISFAFGAEDCDRIHIKLAVDLQNSIYSSRYALQDLLLAIQWPSIKFHVSVCSAVLLHITSDCSLTLAGFDAEHRPKFQFDFFNAADRSAIPELAADTLNNYYDIFNPFESRDVPWFSEMRQLSIHDASGELGRLLDWGTFLSFLPCDVRSLSLGNARVVGDFLRAMDRLACLEANRDPAFDCETQTVRLSRLAWCVNSRSLDCVEDLSRCCAVGILDIGEVVLRVSRQVDADADEPGTPNGVSTPRHSPPPSELEGETRKWRVFVEDGGDRCSICRYAPRTSRAQVQTTDAQSDQDEDPRARTKLDNLKAMSDWDDFTGVWEDHIWNMAAAYNNAEWTYMSA